ncbi:MAG TPA: glycosyltransferase family 1 protein [Chloroflexia bacterium]|nr:glycosyltransferase family 1 protein [Chloroflexia bacterium]
MLPRGTGVAPLRVALDTTYAGVNPTGVGLYSRRLAEQLRIAAPGERLQLRCFGPACLPETHSPRQADVLQELPLNTQGVLPARLVPFRPHIVHATSHIGPVWGPGSLIVTVHDLIFRRHPEDYPRAWLAVTNLLLPIVLRRAAAIIADSQATAEDLHHYYRSTRGKVRVVYPGFDAVSQPGLRPDLHYATLRDLGSQRNQYIVCVGPWSRRKNLPVVLEAFDTLAREVPGVLLVVAGNASSGMKGAQPQELIAGMPPDTQARIRTVGFVPRDKLYALLSGASLLAYPSRIEGFGLPPLEAMSLGVPVVASDAPVLREVAGGSALHVPADDAAAWAAAFRRIFAEPGLAALLSESGRARSSEFSWRRCAAETIAVYQEVAERA